MTPQERTARIQELTTAYMAEIEAAQDALMAKLRSLHAQAIKRLEVIANDQNPPIDLDTAFASV